VRASDAAITVLEVDGQSDRVSDAVAAPSRTNAGFDGSKRLAVSVSRFEPSGDELLPDGGKVSLLCSKEIDALTSSDLRERKEKGEKKETRQRWQQGREQNERRTLV
jgi:hypothetical protein